MAPTIGITADLLEQDGLTRIRCTRQYAGAIHAAGGIPVVLPPVTDEVRPYRDDPATEPFGEPTHPETNRVHPDRQRFEATLLTALDATEHPVLGICLGMQMMALHHGGRLHQHLPESHPDIAASHDCAVHAIHRVVDDCPTLPVAGDVFSRHHQAVADPGSLRLIATAADGLIEAIDAPGARFYLGLQWHPERTERPELGLSIFETFVEQANRFAPASGRNQRP